MFFYKLLQISTLELVAAEVYNCQLCVNTGYSLEDLPKAMACTDREWKRKESILSACPDDFFKKCCC